MKKPVIELIELDHYKGKETIRPAEPGSAGHDLVYSGSKELYHEDLLNPTLLATGIKIHINDPSIFGLLCGRSSLGHKLNIAVANSCGILDSSFTGEIFLSAITRDPYAIANSINDYEEHEPNVGAPVIAPGDRIAQLLFLPVIHPEFKLVEEFTNSSERGDGGFGSTGIK